jgi:hypothetical protein
LDARSPECSHQAGTGNKDKQDSGRDISDTWVEDQNSTHPVD